MPAVARNAAGCLEAYIPFCYFQDTNGQMQCGLWRYAQSAPGSWTITSANPPGPVPSTTPLRQPAAASVSSAAGLNPQGNLAVVRATIAITNDGRDTTLPTPQTWSDFYSALPSDLTYYGFETVLVFGFAGSGNLLIFDGFWYAPAITPH
jgi:hypothetical protein